LLGCAGFEVGEFGLKVGGGELGGGCWFGHGEIYVVCSWEWLVLC
jgi:hypothetical protein